MGARLIASKFGNCICLSIDHVWRSAIVPQSYRSCGVTLIACGVLSIFIDIGVAASIPFSFLDFQQGSSTLHSLACRLEVRIAKRVLLYIGALRRPGKPFKNWF